MGGVAVPEHVGKVYREQGVKVEISYEGEWLTGSTIELMEVRVDELIGGVGTCPTLLGQKKNILLAVKKWPRKNRYCMVLCFLF